MVFTSRACLAQGDTPCSATPLTVSNGTCNFESSTSVGATFQSNAANGGFPSCGFSGSPDVWFSFVVPPSGAVAVTLEAGSITDGALAVYRGDCNLPQFIECDDDDGLDMLPAVDRSDFIPGETIFIRVWNNNAAAGTFGVCVTESHSDCGTAMVLCSNLAVTSNAYGSGSNQDGDFTGTNCIPGEYQSQWFQFQVINTCTLSFTIFPEALSGGWYPDYDWALWQANDLTFCDGFLPNIPAIACNASSSMGALGETGIGPTGVNSSEQAGPGNPFCAQFTAQAGDIFYLWVNNFTNSSSGFHFEFDPSVELNCNLEEPTSNIDSINTCAGTCNGSATVSVTGLETPLQYLWSANANAQTTATATGLCSGVYHVVVTGADGESITDTVEVLEMPVVSVQLTHTNNTSCNEPNGQIHAMVSGGTGAITMEWDGFSTTNDSLFGLSAGTYSLIATDAFGCSDSSSESLSNDIIYPSILSIEANDTAACGRLCANLWAETLNADSFLWDFGDGQTSTSNSAYHCYVYPGDYVVKLIIETLGGCSDSLIFGSSMHVFANPVAEFGSSINDLKVQFNNLSGNASIWNWEFGDPQENSSNSRNPVFEYPDYAEYCVLFSVWDEHLCYDSVSHCFELSPQLTVYVPTAFSPNEDGLNDVFQIFGDPIAFSELWIFNRWGEEIYHTQENPAVWNGRTSVGEQVKQDLYIYKTEVISEQGEKKVLNGLIQVVY